MADVFLSYKTEDRERIKPLVQALQDEGLDVWWDQHIGGGSAWRESIEAELERAKCVIVVWTKRSVGPEGSFVRDEASRAMERGVYLPVTMAPVRPPLGFRETQALNLQGWKGDPSDPRFQALAAAVRGRPNSPVQAGKFARKGMDRRTILLAGGGVLAAGGIATFVLLKSASQQADSIAVLPFANLSGDAAQAYFSDGIAEEIRTALSRIAGLKVVARTSSEVVRNEDVKTAAIKLQVGSILTGSVRKSPTLIRITTQLVDGRNGVERWSEVYDRPFGDTLQIQTDIATKVAEALSIRLGDGDRRAIAEGGTRSAEAQDLLLKARDIARHDDTAAALQRALGTVDSAISLDPRYANAVAAKSVIVNMQGSQLSDTPVKAQRLLREAEALARQAIRIAPRSAEAHGALAFTLHGLLRLRPALREFATMASLPGGGPRADFNSVDNYVWVLALCGRSAPAIARAQEMIDGDPLNPFAYHTMAIALGLARRYDESLRYSERAIAIAPDLLWPRAFRAYYLMQLGDLDGARTTFETLRGEDGVWLVWQTILAHRRGDRAESDRLLSRLQSWGGDGALYQYAEVYAQRGQKNRALAALEQAWSARDPGLVLMKTDPQLDPLRREPRFQDILRKMDFPD